ncbi:hypothetical protein [Thermococcus sp. JCM 11816]|uniref:hypothetical protein n=1 Tax=Thermococcus sp. (strain JCM 11816 / KS-1) TaxID=1295125 RepID=UPI003467B037
MKFFRGGGEPPSKIARVLKFLAFEMLEESKKSKDDEMRKTSKELFELGRKIETGEHAL